MQENQIYQSNSFLSDLPSDRPIYQYLPIFVNRNLNTQNWGKMLAKHNKSWQNSNRNVITIDSWRLNLLNL
jgi:hypothetical protein